MSEQLKAHIKKFISINEQDLNEVVRCFTPIDVKKKENLLTEGKVCTKQYFVAKGCMRMFFVNEKGVEVTIQFALENWWMADYDSFSNQTPSEYHIQAVENSEVLSIDFATQEKMLEQFPQMERRVNIEHALPTVYKAMLGLSATTGRSSLTPIQKELIKMRASQINSCAFCINMHTTEALAIGETQQRIFLLNAWRETDLFTEEEKALLTLTEEVTLISQHGVSEATYQQARKHFSEETIADIIMATVVINAWNRIAVSTQLPVSALVS